MRNLSMEPLHHKRYGKIYKNGPISRTIMLTSSKLSKGLHKSSKGTNNLANSMKKCKKNNELDILQLDVIDLEQI
jgi:hypothetical protein